MEKEIKKTADILRNGGVILYPTDTVWGIGCSALSEDAIGKIYKIKQRSESKSMIVLVDTIERLKNYVEDLPEIALDLIRKAEKPLTIIYPKAMNLPLNLVASDGSIAIRVVNHPFCQKLIAEINAPLVSTSANISGEPTPMCFEDISTVIKDQMEFIVAQCFETSKNAQPSTIIRLIDHENFEVIRS
jgi:L-threonylcarbamoyladenylate synthase